MNSWIAISGMDAGDRYVGLGGLKSVDWVGGGGVEGNNFLTDSEVIAVRSLVGGQGTVGTDTPTS